MDTGSLLERIDQIHSPYTFSEYTYHTVISYLYDILIVARRSGGGGFEDAI